VVVNTTFGLFCTSVTFFCGNYYDCCFDPLSIIENKSTWVNECRASFKKLKQYCS